MNQGRRKVDIPRSFIWIPTKSYFYYFVIPWLWLIWWLVWHIVVYYCPVMVENIFISLLVSHWKEAKQVMCNLSFLIWQNCWLSLLWWAAHAANELHGPWHKQPSQGLSLQTDRATTDNFSTLRTNRLVSSDMLQWPHVACWQHPSSLQFWGLARHSRCHRYPRAPTPGLEFKLAPHSASVWEKTALPCLHIAAHRPITLISSGANEEQAVRNNKQFIIFFSVQISFTFHTDCT